jgi:hypothetical protein
LLLVPCTTFSGWSADAAELAEGGKSRLLLVLVGDRS